MGEYPQTTRLSTTNYSQLKVKVMMEKTDCTSRCTGLCDGQLQPVRGSAILLFNRQGG